MPSLYCYGATGMSMAVAPTDAVTVSGSDTRIIQITRAGFSATSTLGGTLDVALIKRTTPNTGGAFTLHTPSQYDTVDAPASAVVTQYTANPTTLGTGVTIRTQKLLFGTGSAPGQSVFEFISVEPYGIILRGSNEAIAVNFGGVTLLTGSSFDYFIEWKEF